MVKVGAMLIGCILNWGIVFVVLLIGGFLINSIVDIDRFILNRIILFRLLVNAFQFSFVYWEINLLLSTNKFCKTNR